MKILIVDDDTSAIDVIRSTLDLKEIGFSRVLEAYNGVKAKEIILRESPEVILCDIEMPLCNGMELIRWLRERDNQAQFIFFTCFDRFEYAQDSIEYGVSAYITKPIDFHKLRRALVKAVETERKHSARREREENKTSLLHSSSELIREVLQLLTRMDAAEVVPTGNTGSRYYVLAVGSDRSGKAGEIKEILNQVLKRETSSNSYLQYESEGLYYHLTVLNSAMHTPEKLIQSCEEAVEICRERYGSTLHCVISQPQYIAYLPAMKNRLENQIRQNWEQNQVDWLPADVQENRSVQTKTVTAAKAYIDSNFRREISRGELANHTYVSPNYLSKLFVQEVGMSIREYTNSRRIEEAKKLLLQSGKTISEIGGEVGFDSASYFSTVFCKHTGLSPAAWRGKCIQK